MAPRDELKDPNFLHQLYTAQPPVNSTATSYSLPGEGLNHHVKSSQPPLQDLDSAVEKEADGRNLKVLKKLKAVVQNKAGTTHTLRAHKCSA